MDLNAKMDNTQNINNGMTFYFGDDVLGIGKIGSAFIEKLCHCIGKIYTLYNYDKIEEQRLASAKADSEIQIIKATANEKEKDIRLSHQIWRRIELEQLLKQHNLSNVVSRANNLVDDARVNDEEIDLDWLLKFIKAAEDTTSEDLQDLLAQILADEVATPGKYSSRLINFVRNTDKKELELFYRFMSISSDIALYHMGNDFKPVTLTKYGLNTYDLVTLDSLGLIQNSRGLSVITDIDNTGSTNIIFNHYRIFLSCTEKRHVELGVYPLTTLGQELASISKKYIKNSKDSEYTKDLLQYFSDMNISAQISE